MLAAETFLREIAARHYFVFYAGEEKLALIYFFSWFDDGDEIPNSLRLLLFFSPLAPPSS